MANTAYERQDMVELEASLKLAMPIGFLAFEVERVFSGSWASSGAILHVAKGIVEGLLVAAVVATLVV